MVMLVYQRVHCFFSIYIYKYIYIYTGHSFNFIIFGQNLRDGTWDEVQGVRRGVKKSSLVKSNPNLFAPIFNPFFYRFILLFAYPALYLYIYNFNIFLHWYAYH